MDRILDSFLRRQLEEGLALAAASDLLDVSPLPAGLFGREGDQPVAADAPPDRFHARFRCRGLVRRPSGEIAEAERFDVGVWMPPDYARRAPDPFRVLAWLGPRNVWHPNISDRLPVICIGHLVAGTPLVEILERVFDVVTFNNVTTVESNALNPAACAWARRNIDRFPIDSRGLRRRALDLDVEVEEAPR